MRWQARIRTDFFSGLCSSLLNPSTVGFNKLHSLASGQTACVKGAGCLYNCTVAVIQTDSYCSQTEQLYRQGKVVSIHDVGGGGGYRCFYKDISSLEMIDRDYEKKLKTNKSYALRPLLITGLADNSLSRDTVSLNFMPLFSSFSLCLSPFIGITSWKSPP